MKGYQIRIEVKQGEVEDVLKELDEAQQKIYECYTRLMDIGVVTISGAEKTAPEK